MKLKDIVIVVFALIIIFMLVNKKNDINNDDNTELIELKRITDSLTYDNLEKRDANKILVKIFDSLGNEINDLHLKIDSSEVIIKKLKNKKGEVFNNVGNFNSNELSREFTKYLNERK